MIKETMENAEEYMSGKDYESMLSVDNSEGAELIYSTMQGDQYIYAAGEDTTGYTGTAVALCKCSEGYYFYYGSFEDGIRSGEGNSFMMSSDGYYRAYEGSWADGKPNGSGKTIEKGHSVNEKMKSKSICAIIQEILWMGCLMEQ